MVTLCHTDIALQSHKADLNLVLRLLLKHWLIKSWNLMIGFYIFGTIHDNNLLTLTFNIFRNIQNNWAQIHLWQLTMNRHKLDTFHDMYFSLSIRISKVIHCEFSCLGNLVLYFYRFHIEVISLYNFYWSSRRYQSLNILIFYVIS